MSLIKSKIVIQSESKRWPAKLMIPMMGNMAADQMVRLAMLQYDSGNRDGGGDAWGFWCSCWRSFIRSCRRSVSMKQPGFRITGPWSGRSLGASSVASDWQLRLFGFSGLIDRPSDCLCVSTIPLYGYMDRHSRYQYVICVAWKYNNKSSYFFCRSICEIILH